jgi:hypothetical protein
MDAKGASDETVQSILQVDLQNNGNSLDNTESKLASQNAEDKSQCKMQSVNEETNAAIISCEHNTEESITSFDHSDYIESHQQAYMEAAGCPQVFINRNQNKDDGKMMESSIAERLGADDVLGHVVSQGENQQPSVIDDAEKALLSNISDEPVLSDNFPSSCPLLEHEAGTSLLTHEERSYLAFLDDMRSLNTDDSLRKSGKNGNKNNIVPDSVPKDETHSYEKVENLPLTPKASNQSQTRFESSPAVGNIPELLMSPLLKSFIDEELVFRGTEDGDYLEDAEHFGVLAQKTTWIENSPNRDFILTDVAVENVGGEVFESLPLPNPRETDADEQSAMDNQTDQMVEKLLLGGEADVINSPRPGDIVPSLSQLRNNVLAYQDEPDLLATEESSSESSQKEPIPCRQGFEKPQQVTSDSSEWATGSESDTLSSEKNESDAIASEQPESDAITSEESSSEKDIQDESFRTEWTERVENYVAKSPIKRPHSTDDQDVQTVPSAPYGQDTDHYQSVPQVNILQRSSQPNDSLSPHKISRASISNNTTVADAGTSYPTSLAYENPNQHPWIDTCQPSHVDNDDASPVVPEADDNRNESSLVPDLEFSVDIDTASAAEESFYDDLADKLKGMTKVYILLSTFYHIFSPNTLQRQQSFIFVHTFYYQPFIVHFHRTHQKDSRGFFF